MEQGDEVFGLAHVFVVDDDLQVRNVLRRHLELAGHEVKDFPSGEKALEQAARTPPDVMVIDIFMDGIEGLELTRRVKSADWSTKIIAMSGGGVMSRRSVLEVASLLGAHSTLTKPFSGKELVELVAELCESDRPQEPPQPGPEETD